MNQDFCSKNQSNISRPSSCSTRGKYIGPFIRREGRATFSSSFSHHFILKIPAYLESNSKMKTFCKKLPQHRIMSWENVYSAFSSIRSFLHFHFSLFRHYLWILLHYYDARVIQVICKQFKHSTLVNSLIDTKWTLSSSLHTSRILWMDLESNIMN